VLVDIALGFCVFFVCVVCGGCLGGVVGFFGGGGGGGGWGGGKLETNVSVYSSSVSKRRGILFRLQGGGTVIPIDSPPCKGIKQSNS